jgi:hypothetical protein
LKEQVEYSPLNYRGCFPLEIGHWVTKCERKGFKNASFYPQMTKCFKKPTKSKVEAHTLLVGKNPIKHRLSLGRLIQQDAWHLI